MLQPEYPMRTKLQFYQQVEPVAPAFEIDMDNTRGGRRLPSSSLDSLGPDHFLPESNGIPSTSTLFVFWIFGLVVWSIMFMGPSQGGKGYGKARKKAGQIYKDV